MNKFPIPTIPQEEWANCELGVIIHYNLETFHPDLPQNKWKSSPDVMTADTFAPKEVDTDQWMEAAKAMGAKYAVFVANHVTGFAMWPTKQNKYSVVGSPYLDGKADIVRDFINSCKKYDIKPGLYYSTGCNGYYGINDEMLNDTQTETYRNYIKVVESQLEELWGNYGELFEIWFDGGVISLSQGGPNVLELIRKYQPEAICFQGLKEQTHNLRWVGNERGEAPLNCWSTSTKNTCSFGGTEEDRGIGKGNPEGEYWIPAESDMGNRSKQASGGGWGWREGEEHLVYKPEHLLDCYYNTVGRNSNLLLGMAIHRDGYFPDVQQFNEFGRLVNEIYADPVKSTSGTGNKYELDLTELTYIKNISIMEDIHYGERVRDFTVTVETENGMEEIFNAECIGHKRLIKLEKKIKKAILTINQRVDTVIIKDFTLYA
ncbi:hypothetical protein GC098_30985 [Paenibacillus sp. LMG 31458]|uniref:alpha-L-fucosidase n=1 Tax=Paenibacillus phytorum TaxID=2654977 RepID=A0ABX1Y677_9BACL|nr:alpha-L-fucosidase [Paenibacillus phytorum]NOU75741.1 hypothetical protein [Paenibacillus phytorum]